MKNKRVWFFCILFFLGFCIVRQLIREDVYTFKVIAINSFSQSLSFSILGFVIALLISLFISDDHLYMKRVSVYLPWGIIVAIVLFGTTNLYFEVEKSKAFNSLQHNPEKEKIYSDEQREWIIQNRNSASKAVSNDEFEGSLYRNNKYNFRIRFINGWEFRKGDGRGTVIKSVQADSAKTISVTIGDYPKLGLDGKNISSEDLTVLKDYLVDGLKMQKVSPINLKIREGFLNNFPAIIISFRILQRHMEQAIEYDLKQIACISDGKVFVITSSIPSFLYTPYEIKRVQRVFDSFIFEKAF